MTTFYVDETGYTGEDLLNADQTLFAQATVDFTDEEAGAAIQWISAGVPAAELKSNRLLRSARHRDRIVDLVRFAAADPNRAGIWIADKEFAMVTLVVDWWIEPLAHQGGLNLYEDGAHLGMANMLYCTLQGFWGFEFRRRLLLLFQTMFRERTEASFRDCAAFVDRAYREADGSRADILRYLWCSFHLLGFQHVLGLPSRVLDLALPA